MQGARPNSRTELLKADRELHIKHGLLALDLLSYYDLLYYYYWYYYNYLYYYYSSSSSNDNNSNMNNDRKARA